MYKIRVTLKDGRKFYVNEGWPYSEKRIELKDSYSQALSYQSTLEFRVAWQIYQHCTTNGIAIENPNYTSMWNRWQRISSHDVKKFEAIDDQTLKKTVIKMDKKERVSKTIIVPPDQFEMLKICRWASCHWLYAGKKWIAFPETEKDYARITMIKYYRRGLSGIIFSGFIYRNMRRDILPNYFEDRRELLFNENLYKIYLRDDIDSCKSFTLFKST